ncbi:ATP-dependent DNA ligase [Microbacterium lacus]
MGKFTYDQEVRVDIDDRLLLHLQIVIGNKLRRGESFYFSWRLDPSLGHGRRSVWIHPYAALTFTFGESRTTQMSRAWIEALATTANSQRGLYAVPEPAPDAVGDGEIRELMDA